MQLVVSESRAFILRVICGLLTILSFGCCNDDRGIDPEALQQPAATSAEEVTVFPMPDALNIQRAIMSNSQEIAFRVGKATFTLRRIPSGEFDFDSPTTDAMAERSDTPLRHVQITKAFYIGVVEITQLQYQEVVGPHSTKFVGDSLPVEDITYSEAIKFCRSLSRMIRVKVTLPTEAQWEYACRAGTRFRFCSGNEETDLQKVAWYEKNSGGKTHEVGQKEPNGFGLYDMLGNVWEPCLDNLLDCSKISEVNPKGEECGTLEMMRGGWWHGTADECRPGERSYTNDMFGGMGIRIVINPREFWGQSAFSH